MIHIMLSSGLDKSIGQICMVQKLALTPYAIHFQFIQYFVLIKEHILSPTFKIVWKRFGT